MPNFQLIIDSNMLALYGAILSTILAIMSYTEHHKNKAIIKVTVKGEWIFTPKELNPFSGEETLVNIKAVNIGHRPTTITTAGLLLPKSEKNGFLMCADSFCKALQPTELSEGKAKNFYMGETTLKNKYNLTPDEYVAYVCDEAGRVFYSHNIIQRYFILGRIK